MIPKRLPDYLAVSAARWPTRTAVVGPDRAALTYAELHRRSDALAGFLASRGVARGDRVGVVLPKTADAVVALFGIMKAGAAYVPVDFTAPAERGRTILSDCHVAAAIVDARALAVVPQTETLPRTVIVVGAIGGSMPGVPTTAFEEAVGQGLGAPVLETSPSDLAYILYTSGSTGVPKGVMLTHENGMSFVDWCSSVFAPKEQDRFSSHAPFHFDLSVLDIYLPIKHGAALYLISEEIGKSPKDLARFIAEHRLTIWYSTPSILMLLMEFGNLPAHDASSLRTVLFAGEVFPVKHLRELTRLWPAPAYYNLYGPTETNVCTFAAIPRVVPDDRTIPYPIGVPCSHCRALVLDEHGREVAQGDEGVLYISGPSVFSGYWNRPVENAAAFVTRDGVRWYCTGDVVRWNENDGFLYIGRRDRMVKRRGYRIELGEIERALYQHPQVREAAVVSCPDEESGTRIIAYLACRAGSRPSIVELKTFCGSKLPAYMSPDRLLFVETLPKTSTDKIDYQTLRRQAAGSPTAVAR